MCAYTAGLAAVALTLSCRQADGTPVPRCLDPQGQCEGEEEEGCLRKEEGRGDPLNEDRGAHEEEEEEAEEDERRCSARAESAMAACTVCGDCGESRANGSMMKLGRRQRLTRAGPGLGKTSGP